MKNFTNILFVFGLCFCGYAQAAEADADAEAVERRLKSIKVIGCNNETQIKEMQEHIAVFEDNVGTNSPADKHGWKQTFWSPEVTEKVHLYAELAPLPRTFYAIYSRCPDILYVCAPTRNASEEIRAFEPSPEFMLQTLKTLSPELYQLVSGVILPGEQHSLEKDDDDPFDLD